PGTGRGAADMDDMAAGAAAQHERQAGMRYDEGAVENDAGDLVPLRERHVEKRHLGTDRGIVDEDIEPAETRVDPLHHATHRCLVDDIGEADHAGAAELLDLA